MLLEDKKNKNMIHLYYFLAGFLCSSILFFFLFFLRKKKLTPKAPLKSGLLTRSYICSDAYQKGISVDYEIEVVEIDSNGTKSKIKVLSNRNRRGEKQPAVTSSQSSFGDLYWKTKISDQLDNTWVETNSIEWFSNPASERDKKITEILK